MVCCPTSRGGRDSIDHPPGFHDDLANACGGVLVRLDGVSKIGTGGEAIVWFNPSAWGAAGQNVMIETEAQKRRRIEKWKAENPPLPPEPASPGNGAPPSDYAERREREVATREAHPSPHNYEKMRNPIILPTPTSRRTKK